MDELIVWTFKKLLNIKLLKNLQNLKISNKILVHFMSNFWNKFYKIIYCEAALFVH